MTQIRSFDEAEKVLAKYIPLAREIIGKDLTLDRTLLLMELFGNPERKLKIVHIAGTSGKTSTTYYIAELLKVAGQKVGMTVSPHIDSIAERLQINLEPLGEKEFCAALAETVDIIEASDVAPTYYELLIALAYWYFAKVNVDYAVIETGLGGLQDSTNVAAEVDKLCVITDIGYDHMQVLGSTLPEISLQKAGIIHEGNQVLMYEQSSEITNVIKNWCDQKSAKLSLLKQEDLEKSFLKSAIFKNLPDFQKRNWLLAYQAYNFLQTRDNLPELSIENLEESIGLQVPARMDKRVINGKTIIMDGAHNEQKMQAFVDSFRAQYPGRKVPVLLAMKKGKEYQKVLKLLKSATDKLILSSFRSWQDEPASSLPTETLTSTARQLGFEDIAAEPDLTKAFKRLLAEPSDLAIITGSFYLLAELRKNNEELRNAKS